MTDFYAILKSIIAEARADDAKLRASLYARARGMLERQLDALDPPPPAAARQQQHARFEDAVRRIETEIASRPAQTASAAGPRAPLAAMEELEAPPYLHDEDDEAARIGVPRQRRGGAAFLALLVLLIIGGGGALAYWRWEEVRPPIASLISEVRTRLGIDAVEGPAEPVQQEAAGDAAAPETRSEPPAPTEVMEVQPRAPRSTGDDEASQPPRDEAAGASDKDEARVPAAALATERAFLIVEQGGEGNEDKRFAGTALWSLGGSGADTSVAVAVSIPDRSAELSIVIRPNADQSLLASHTIDVVYHAPAGGEGLITNVPGFMVRVKNGDSSIPLRGAGALVVPGQYLIGLSGAPADRAHNTSMLKNAEWLVIPAEFESKRKTVIVIEKGASGQAAMAKAFAAWEAAKTPAQIQ
ncbi:MAG: hypothetical protein Q8P46_09800 [Hyphomicrobiales bacterium]|nr:hypothetical protein [Hyphomicrobiales bacterium]